MRLAVLVLVLAACDGIYEIRLPQCRTPMPVFTTEPASPADSVNMGCPYAYIAANGDTIVVVYDPGLVP